MEDVATGLVRVERRWAGGERGGPRPHSAFRAVAASAVLWLVAGLWCGQAARAADSVDAAGRVRVGDTMEQVEAALGAPKGKFGNKGRIIWVYDAGSVEFESGVVAVRRLRGRLEGAAGEPGQPKESAPNGAGPAGTSVGPGAISVRVAEPAAAPATDAGEWRTYVAKSIRLHTPVDGRLAQVILDGIQAYHDHVAARFFEGPFETPLDVYYAVRAEDSLALMKAHGLRIDEIGYGLYVPERPAVYTHRLLADGSATGLGTLFHELTHHFVRRDFPGCPAWFNEGLATLLGEQSRPVLGGMDIGHPNPWRERQLRELLEQKGFEIDVSRLITLSDRNFYAWKDWYHVTRALFFYIHSRGRLRIYMDLVREHDYGLHTLEGGAEANWSDINVRLKAFIAARCYPAADYHEGIGAPDAQGRKRAFQKALAVDPNYGAARLALARVYQQDGEHQACADTLEPLLDRPGSQYYAEAHNVLAHSLFAHKDAAEALEHYEIGRDNARYDEYAYWYAFNIAVCHQSLGRPGKARNWYETFLREDWEPDRTREFVDRARGYLAQVR